MQKEKEADWRNCRVPFSVYSKYTIETEVIKRTGRKQKKGEVNKKATGGGERTLNIYKNIKKNNVKLC